MKNEHKRFDRTVVRLLAVPGACAFVALTVLGAHYSADSDGSHALAGSGDAPANTTYLQPVVGAATMGATATWTTPGPTPEVVKAVPLIKAGG